MHAARLLVLTFGLLGVGALVPGIPVWGCKYTVRDVAFVDLDGAGYTVQFVEGPGVPGDAQAWVTSAMRSLLPGSNVVLETAQVRSDGAPAPSFWLRRTPRGPFTIVPADSDGHGRVRESAVWESVQSLVTSPVRRQILAECLTAHSVVLIVEGAEARSRLRSRELAKAAIAEIDRGLPRLPKKIERGPRIVTISPSKRPEEAVLLWSLGVPKSGEESWIVPLIGRGRPLGAPMNVTGLTVEDLVERLSIAGQDCECGLERSWMQAPMIPHVWTEDDEAAAVRALGFDPGHPLVKSEMVRILARGPGYRGERSGGRTPDVDPEDDLLGYTEIELGDGGEAGPGWLTERAVVPGPTTTVEIVEPHEEVSMLTSTWITIAAIVLLALAGGAGVLIRGGGRG